MICSSLKRLFRVRLLLQKVEQTLHQSEGSFGRQINPRKKMPPVEGGIFVCASPHAER